MKLMCPLLLNPCPSSKPFKCDNGVCAKSLNMCPRDNGCPYAMPNKCPQTGICVESILNCTDYASQVYIPNGCTILKPIKCWNGTCVASGSECTAKPVCTPEKPFKCWDGSCGENADSCGNITIGCLPG